MTFSIIVISEDDYKFLWSLAGIIQQPQHNIFASRVFREFMDIHIVHTFLLYTVHSSLNKQCSVFHSVQLHWSDDQTHNNWEQIH